MAIVQTRGWCQGDYVNKQGSVCADMAIQMASREGPREIKAAEYFQAAVCTDSIIPRWNDYLTTTYEDVILGFKWAAEMAERAGD